MLETMKVVIVAGGKGTRIKEKTENKIPKGLVNICGRPILSYQLDAISKMGIQDVHISFGERYFIDLFQYYLKRKLIPEMSYDFSIHRNDPLSTFKTKEARKFVRDKPFIFSLDDLFYTEDVLKQILRKYEEKDCTIVLKSPVVEYKNDLEFVLRDGYVVSWRENNTLPWTIGPILVLDEGSNKLFLEEEKKQPPRKLEFLKTCIKKKLKVYAMKQPEPLININRIKDYYDAEIEIKKRNYHK